LRFATHHSPEYSAKAYDDGFGDVPENKGSVKDDEARPLAIWMAPKAVIASNAPSSNQKAKRQTLARTTDM